MKINLKLAAALGLSLAASGALMLVSIHVPFGRDQGVAAYVAMVMAHGGAAYRDVYHFNFPGIFFVYRLAALLPLGPVEAVNATHLAFMLIAQAGVFLAARRVVNNSRAVLAAALFAVYAAVLYTNYWDIAQKEGLAAPALAFSLWLSLRALASERGRAALLNSLFAGLLAGLAAMFKPTLGIVLIAALHPALSRKKFAPALAAILGFALAFVPLALYLSAHHAASAMIESVFSFGGFYGGQNYTGFVPAIIKTIRAIGSWAFNWRFLTVLAVAGIIAAKPRRAPAFSLTLLFGTLLLLQAVVQMKFFTYHWIPLLIPVSIIAASGWDFLVSSETIKPRKAAIIAVLVALFLGNLIPETARYRREYLYGRGLIDRAQFLSPYGRWGGTDMAPLAGEAVADYLREHTREDDPILVFGLEPGIYVMAGRMAPTRFAYDQPLVTDPRGGQAFAAYREKIRAEFMADLERRPPLYIAVISNDATVIEDKDSFTQMREFAELSNFIDRHYVLETKIEDYFLFKRLEGGD